MAYKAGDKVKLKSGGPVLTVDNVIGNRVAVTWTDNEGTEQTEEYLDELLKPAEGAPE